MIFESIETALKANTILFAAIHLGVVTVCLALFLFLTRSRKKNATAVKDDNTFTDDLVGKPHFRPAKASPDRPSTPGVESAITPPSKQPAPPPPPGVHLQRQTPIRLEVIQEPPSAAAATSATSDTPAVRITIPPKDSSGPEEPGNGTIRFPEGMPPVISTGSDPVAHRTKEEVAIRIYQLFQGKDTETLIAIDREEHILALNPGAEKLFQYLSHELRGKKIEDVIFLEAGDKEAAKKSGTDSLDEEDKQRAKGHAKDGSSFPVGVELEMADRPLGIILVRIHTLDLLVKPGKPVFDDLPSEEPEQKTDILSKVAAITASAVVLHPIMGDSKPVEERIDPAPEPTVSPNLVEEALSPEPATAPVEATGLTPEPQTEVTPVQETGADLAPSPETQAPESPLEQPRDAAEEGPTAPEAEPLSTSEESTPEPEAVIPESTPEADATEAAVVDLEPVVETEIPQEIPDTADSHAPEVIENITVPVFEAAVEPAPVVEESIVNKPTEDKGPDIAESTVIGDAVDAEDAIVPVDATGPTPEPQTEVTPVQETSADEGVSAELTPSAETQAPESPLEQPKEATEEPAATDQGPTATESEPLSVSEESTPESEAVIPESKTEAESAEPVNEAAVIDLEPVVETDTPQEISDTADSNEPEVIENITVPVFESAVEPPPVVEESIVNESTEDKGPDIVEPTVIGDAVDAEDAIVPVDATGLTPEPQTEATPVQETITDEGVSADLTPSAATQASESPLEQPKAATEEPAAADQGPAAHESEPLSVSEESTPESGAVIPESKTEAESAEPVNEAAVIDLEPVVVAETPQETSDTPDSNAPEVIEGTTVPVFEAAVETAPVVEESIINQPTEDKGPDIAEPTVIGDAVDAEPSTAPVDETGDEPEPLTEATPVPETITDEGASTDLTPSAATQASESPLEQPKDATEEPAAADQGPTASESEPLSVSEESTPEPEAVIPESKTEADATEAEVVDLEPVVEALVPQDTPDAEMIPESSQTPENIPSLGEIEQPLHSISRIAKLMAVEQPDAQRIKEYAEAIEERSNRMAEQIEELKAMLRQTRSQGASSSKLTPIDISRLADILANEASSLVSSSDKRVQCNILDADSLYGLGNESGLTQVINSLIDLGLHCIGSGCVHIDVRSDETEPLVNASESYSLNGRTLVPDSRREVIIQTRFQASPAIRQYLESAFGPNPDFDAIEDDPSIAILAGIASRIRLSVRAMNGRFVFETPVADEVMVQTQWDMQCLREEL